MERGIATASAAFGLVSLCALWFWWPWAGWPVWIGTAFVIAGLASCGRLLFPAKDLGDTSWRGVPAKIVCIGRAVVRLETPSSYIRSSAAASSLLMSSAPVVERVGGLGVGVALVISIVVAPCLWTHLHPVLRVVNVSPQQLHVAVDGKAQAAVPPSWTEDPRGGVRFRVPIGWRVFEAHSSNGDLVERTGGVVSVDHNGLYAPDHRGFCFRIERQPYGKVSSLAGGVVELPSGASFYSLPSEVDGWFQPNPENSWNDGRFSGGLRTAVRFGPCAAGR